ncbi:MAG TPA: hypothetical protein VFQ60_03885, partial [Patescibacteria group bacterium]|nr:hypothetical protein [Patescibacteria group bacterium]
AFSFDSAKLLALGMQGGSVMRDAMSIDAEQQIRQMLREQRIAFPINEKDPSHGRERLMTDLEEPFPSLSVERVQMQDSVSVWLTLSFSPRSFVKIGYDANLSAWNVQTIGTEPESLSCLNWFREKIVGKEEIPESLAFELIARGIRYYQEAHSF